MNGLKDLNDMTNLTHYIRWYLLYMENTLKVLGIQFKFKFPYIHTNIIISWEIPAEENNQTRQVLIVSFEKYIKRQERHDVSMNDSHI